jgi:hypothetical protein
MRSLILLVLMLAISDTQAESSCEISGNARLWAYDASLWRYETDDTLHPSVMDCADENLALIDEMGDCQAKHIFKERICTLARQWNLKDPDPATCMSVDKPLGPSVRDGGI